ncbi:hypothetical protein QL898_12980 [Psychrobacter sp. APC 3279]|uniref:hypothetical protein n=1 Tax=Psychrobacter sp. APC 3279 TaxID=3035189 RepID=UPI0025B57EAD|nr:hypothetical protein [Psychrobacter sp. APC 3279]MDN3442545.1 hypothetical protein [Psychrobacter sp. APC 3279]
MLDDREKRRKLVLEQREKRKKKQERQSKERGDIWKLFFEPNPEFAKFFLQPIPWLLGLAVFSIILVIVIDLFEFFTS